MKKLLATIALLVGLTASGAEFGTVNGTVGTFTALTNAGAPVLKASDTNGWDVSAGGGGGGNADDTNYWGVLHYGSNDWQTLVKDVTNGCIFSLEVADFGDLCDPATGLITTRKTGWWEVSAAWWLVHPISVSKIGVFSVMTNGVHWVSHAKGATSDARLETAVWRVQDRAHLPSGTVVRCMFYHNSLDNRVGGGDTDHVSGYPANCSVFRMDFIQE